jgi:signal transduction histidine kinase
VAVQDTGNGIAPEALPHLFDSYNRIPDERGKEDHDMGLGLFIVRTLAELHGGRVTAESPGPGQGSTFTLWLPERCPS